MESLNRLSVFRFATLWTITRTDGTILRFTDHDEPLTYDDDTFEPTDSINASARLKSDQFQDRGLDAKGVISSSAISHEDLRAGRYRDAQIDERVIDWLCPWEGLFLHQRYFILETRFDGESWEADLVGLSRKLRGRVGRTFNRFCDATLGDSRCGLDLSAWTTNNAVVTWVSSGNPRKNFRAAALPNVAYYDFGKVTWVTGNNAGLIGETKKWVQADREVRFHLAMPFDIQIGDTFNIEPGCKKLPEYCKGTSGDADRPWSNNILNFRGFPFIPGTDTLIRTPR